MYAHGDGKSLKMFASAIWCVACIIAITVCFVEDGTVTPAMDRASAQQSKPVHTHLLRAEKSLSFLRLSLFVRFGQLDAVS